MTTKNKQQTNSKLTEKKKKTNCSRRRQSQSDKQKVKGLWRGISPLKEPQHTQDGAGEGEELGAKQWVFQEQSH